MFGERGEFRGGQAGLLESLKKFCVLRKYISAEPITKGIRFTFMSLIPLTMWEYFSVF